MWRNCSLEACSLDGVSITIIFSVSRFGNWFENSPHCSVLFCQKFREILCLAAIFWPSHRLVVKSGTRDWILAKIDSRHPLSLFGSVTNNIFTCTYDKLFAHAQYLSVFLLFIYSIFCRRIFVCHTSTGRWRPLSVKIVSVELSVVGHFRNFLPPKCWKYAVALCL